MQLFALKASEALTKTYTKRGGEIIKTPYPMTWEFTSIEENVTSLAEFKQVIERHAALGHCLLKGRISRPLVSESRAGSTVTSDATEWLVLDFDGLPEEIDVETKEGSKLRVKVTLEYVMRELKLEDISYIVQYSASYGINDKRLRAHIFIMLDKPYAAPLLKQWLIQKNHEVPFLRDAMELTKTGNAIRWPLDISACQNDKLIYIAPPVLKGIKDPMGKEPRIQLVKGKYDVLSLTSGINSTEKNKNLTHARINELRDKMSLPPRKFNYKVVGSTEVMLKPDEAVITDMKVERGFVYFNINGGDSWAYYHPEDKPDYIYNFKGEPTYLTKELLPSYWAEITSRGVTRTSSSGIMYLAFCDRRTGTYWRGTFDRNNDVLEIYQAKNETQIRHFCAQHGVPIGDYIPEWDLVFDPHDSVRVDEINRTVNRFKPSVYMKSTVRKTVKCPPTIFKVLFHAVGEDVEIAEHFINWLAYILQHRDRTKTAWVLHGTQGTGKGILTNNILRPIFGAHTTSRRMEELNEKYNHFMAESLLVFVDEVQIKALGNERGIMAKLKNFITEEFVPVRAMHANAVETRNYTNWIFMSNMTDPVMIDKGDRRFNVGKYQPNKLIISDQELTLIENELQAFHDYLMTYAIDIDRVRQVLHSTDRDNMIAVSESAIDGVSSALLEGNFAFFMDQLPTDDSYTRNALLSNKVEEYRDVLKRVLVRTRPDGKCNISRDELYAIYEYLVGNISTSPNKFTAMLKHHRIHMEAVWVGAKTVRGISVTWADVDKFADYSKEFIPRKEKT